MRRSAVSALPNPPRALPEPSHHLLEPVPQMPTEWAGLSKHLLTLEEAGKILRVGRTTVWEMVNAGDLTAVRIRGKLLIPREEPLRLVADLIEDARVAARTRQSVRRNRQR
jgi:excisionase family DNA binding protein